MPTGNFLQLDKVFSALGVLPDRITLLSALQLSEAHTPPFPPDAPALLWGIPAAESEALKTVLCTVYPANHPVRVILPNGGLLDSHLSGLDSSGEAWYVLPLGDGTAFEAFQEIVAHLRAPDGCPWDREQTHQTLRQHLLEESYEVLDAIDTNEPAKMREELGDLLLQIVLNAQIAVESGEFTMAEVIEGIHSKIIRRHPHVFGEAQVDGVGQVLSNWEKIKAEERKGNEKDKGLLGGVPKGLPALNQAQEYQERAARVGFDWPEIEGVLEKIREEIDEVRLAENSQQLVDELGDLFFALVNLARWKGVDAESALRAANRKFGRRFAYVEQKVRETGQTMQALDITVLDAFWNEAKRVGQ